MDTPILELAKDTVQKSGLIVSFRAPLLVELAKAEALNNLAEAIRASGTTITLGKG